MFSSKYLSLIFAAQAFATNCPPTQYFNGRTCSTTCGQTRPGIVFSTQYTGSLQSCVQLCGNNAQCSTAQFVELTGICTLQSNSPLGVIAVGIDNVVCSGYQSPSTTFTTKTSSSSSTCPITTVTTTSFSLSTSTVTATSVSVSTSTVTAKQSSSTCPATTTTVIAPTTVTSISIFSSTCTATPTTVTSILVYSSSCTASTTTTTAILTTTAVVSQPVIITTVTATSTATSTVTASPTPSTDAFGCTTGNTYTDAEGNNYVEVCQADYPNHDISNMMTTSYDACIEYCGTVSGCVAAVYNTFTLICYAKSYVINDHAYNNLTDAALLLAPQSL